MKLKPFFLALLAPLLLSLIACTSSAFSPRTWQAHTFAGPEFLPGEKPGRPSLWLRDGFIPRTDKPGAQAVDIGRLPPKSGAVAGICYLQTSGGKLVDQADFQAFPDEQITIRNDETGIFITRTDDNGYFIEMLYPGKYEFYCRGAVSSAVIAEGKTTLVQIRGGKRMAD